MYQTRRFNSKKSGKTSLAFEHRPRLFCPIETEKSLTQTTIQKSTLLLPVQMSTLYIPKIPRLSSLASIRAFNDANFLLKPCNPMSVVETWHDRYRNHRIFVSKTKQIYGSPDQLTWTQLRLRYGYTILLIIQVHNAWKATGNDCITTFLLFLPTGFTTFQSALSACSIFGAYSHSQGSHRGWPSSRLDLLPKLLQVGWNGRRKTSLLYI